MDKPLEIVGDGERDEIVVQATGKSAIVFKTTYGRVANLTLRQMVGEGQDCVDIGHGMLTLENCDISSLSMACVAIHGFADPRLRHNKIHDGNDCGIFVYEYGQGIIEENDIFGNAYSGVEIETGSNPTLRRNKIHNGNIDGVSVHTNGRGIIEENDIFENSISGVDIREGGNPILRRNRINRNGSESIRIYSGGAGVIEDNDLRDNKKGAWYISKDSELNVIRSGNLE